MQNSSNLTDHSFRRAAQFLVTIVLILLVGKFISWIPVMTRVALFDSITLAEIIWFVTKLTALVFFFIFARYLAYAIPNKGGVLLFLRGVAEPLTVLIIVILGQELVWEVIDRFVGSSGETIYFSLVAILIIGISIWLLLKVYQHALSLVDSSQSAMQYFAKWAPGQSKICPACGQEVAKNKSYCGYCGHRMEEVHQCANCGEELLAEQKFCPHCGHPVDE